VWSVVAGHPRLWVRFCGPGGDRVGLASIDRTAYPRFKRVVSARELAEAFTPTPRRSCGRVGRRRAILTCWPWFVRLKVYQRLGYFPKLPDIPAVVVDSVRGVLGLPVEVSLETGAERTAKRHRQFVRAAGHPATGTNPPRHPERGHPAGVRACPYCGEVHAGQRFGQTVGHSLATNVTLGAHEAGHGIQRFA
jgi:hypothetical protein